MASRSAEATIKGYFYQFDNSILEILNLNDDLDSISVEGIEDIDINTATEQTAIQCKYYEGTEYNHSVIAGPIRLMLNHFSDYKKGKGSKINYIIRGHYKSGQHKLSLPIDIDFLKSNFLTYKHKAVKYEHHLVLSLNDSDLNEFLTQLTFDINAKNFEDQFQEIVSLLKQQFTCENFSAEHFYYNNSLKQIKELSIKSKLADRTITKKDFLNSINTKKVLFNEWFIALKSKKEYLKQINASLKSKRVLEPSRSKIILIGNNVLSSNNLELPIENFIENIIAKYYKLNSSLRDAKPITIILDCDEKTIINLKINLINNNLIFNDGFEHLKFSSSFFNSDPVKNTTSNGNKILKSSYLVKIISRITFDLHFEDINSPTIFLNFSNSDVAKQFPNGQFFDIKYCDNLSDVHQIITK